LEQKSAPCLELTVPVYNKNAGHNGYSKTAFDINIVVVYNEFEIVVNACDINIVVMVDK